jgi:DEAD/DEAH box helicase
MVTYDNSNLDAYLAQLTPSDRAEALAAAEAAKRAEERAEQRALERAIREKEEQRRREKQQEEKQRLVKGFDTTATALFQNEFGKTSEQQRLTYIPKRKRDLIQNDMNNEIINGDGIHGDSNTYGTNQKIFEPVRSASSSNSIGTAISSEPALTTKERLAVVQTYLGKSATATLQVDDQQQPQKKKQLRTNKKATFKFRWDETDDTSNFDDPDDPIYAPLHTRHSTSNSTVQSSLRKQRQNIKGIMGGEISNMVTVMEKPIEQMTARDWRILRENFEITVRGGQAPPPMRSFSESPAPSYLPQLHPALLDAIYNVLRFNDPSPIQRQAIPIGLQRRDLIGISETGSGKTVAFGVPMCHYLLNLPSNVLESVADQGPLAIVMAPTRELAIQIEVQFSKLLSRQRIVKSTVVVGGQPIQQQAQAIRRGVHIIVGTPGRINDCIEMAYLVLNQCCYIVMDEADRMIDMGFAPQMESMYV